MAYIDTTKPDEPPYPNLAGEFCGNHFKGGRAYACDGQTQSEANEQQQTYLARMRFGRPRPDGTATTEELEARGLVGLYLKEDDFRKLSKDEVACPTPPELLEPGYPRD